METHTTPVAIITPKELSAMLHVSRKTVDRMDADGTGPRSMQLSPGRIGYRLADVNEWLERPRTRRQKPRALEAA